MVTDDASRLPVKYIGASFLESLPSVMGSVLAILAACLVPDLLLAPIVIAVSGLYILGCLVEPVWRRAFTLVEISEHHLRVTTGLLRRRERTLAWSDIDSVASRQSWAFRLCKLSVLQLAQAGDEQLKIELPGIELAMKERIVTRIERARSDAPRLRPEPRRESVGVHDSASADLPTGALIYRANVTELLMASFVYGQFAVIGASMAFAVWETLGEIGVGDVIEHIVGANPVIAACAIGLCIMLAGFALTVIRYARFEVRRDPTGQVEIDYGLIDLHTRRVDPAAIIGVVLQQNLIETMLGRVRLALLSTDSSALLGGNLLLPSLPRKVVAGILHESFGEFADMRSLSADVRYVVPRRLLILVVTLAVPVVTWWMCYSAGIVTWLTALVALVALGAVWAIGRLLCSQLLVSDDGHCVVHISRHVVERQRVIMIGAIHGVSTNLIVRRGFLVRAYYVAGAPRTLAAVKFSPRQMDSLAAALATASGEKRSIGGRRRRSFSASAVARPPSDPEMTRNRIGDSR